MTYGRVAVQAVFGIVVAWALIGCATTSSVVVNPTVVKKTYQTAYVVVHGDRSSDVDARVQTELLKHGISARVGSDSGDPGDAQLIVRYADDWKWDMAMYLHTLDIMVFDGQTKTLLATAGWKNSAMHGFYSLDKVVASVVDQVFQKLSP